MDKPEFQIGPPDIIFRHLEKNNEKMKASLEKVRIDKWLWAVRLFKSRSIATEACEKGKIKIAGQPVKPSRNIKAGDIISIRRGAFTLQYEVLQLTANRQPAKSAAVFCKNLTPPEELERIKLHAIETRAYRNFKEGRPGKRDGRELEEFIF